MEYTQLQLQSTPASRWELKEALRNTQRQNDILYATKASLFSGSYTDLTNKPTFATVATTGSFSDLVNIPFDVTNSQYVKIFRLSGLWQTSIGFNNDTDSYNQTAIGQYIKLRYPGVAVGQYNVPTNYANFIVGSGSAENARKNGLVVDTKGYVYICGVNGYDGTNTVDPTDGTRSLNNFLNNLSAENVAYDSTETYTSETVGYAIKQLETAIGGAGTSPITYTEGEGYSTGNAYAIGDDSFATGESAAFGDRSHAEGDYYSTGTAITVTVKDNYDPSDDYISVLEESDTIPDLAYLVYNGKAAGISYLSSQSDYNDQDEEIPYTEIYLENSNLGEISAGTQIELHVGGIAKGESSHVEGVGCIAYGNGSHAEGFRNLVNGNYAHGEGYCNQALGNYSHVEGKYNHYVSDAISTIGIGTSDNNRSNAIIVMENGDIYVKGVGGYTGTNVGNGMTPLQTILSSVSGGISQSSQSGTNLSPSRTSTSFNESTNHDILVPEELWTTLGQNSACLGKDTYSTGVSSFASGDNVLAKGDNSAAFGEGSFTFGDGSISAGVNDVMPCYIYVSRDNSYSGGSPRRYDITIQPTASLQNYDQEEVLDNMIIAIMPNHINNVIDGIVYAQLFDVRFDVNAQSNSFGQYMYAKAYIADEDLEVSYESDYEQQMTHTIGESDSAYYGLLCRSANGKASATIGKNLMTSNEGEVAVGNCNVSHKKQTDLAGTIFSVGARGLVSKAERSNTNYDEWAEDEWYDPEDADATTVANVNAFFNTADCSSPSNALEVLDDGKVFIRGIGGFNGLNSTTSGVKSVQEVISDLTQQVAALTNS